eukprot:1157407-Pelagomonas_calceolata.AAC.1
MDASIDAIAQPYGWEVPTVQHTLKCSPGWVPFSFLRDLLRACSLCQHHRRCPHPLLGRRQLLPTSSEQGSGTFTVKYPRCELQQKQWGVEEMLTHNSNVKLLRSTSMLPPPFKTDRQGCAPLFRRNTRQQTEIMMSSCAPE